MLLPRQAGQFRYYEVLSKMGNAAQRGFVAIYGQSFVSHRADMTVEH